MFLLSKWYLDCVTEDGDALIIHSALMKRGFFGLQYSAVLFSSAAGKSEERLSLRSVLPPSVRDAAVELELPRLGVAGTWEAATPGFRRILYETAAGKTAWTCHNPGGEVDLTFDGTAMKGQGYVEELTSTVPPWRLPLDELRWGRFIGGAERVTWVEWRGASPKLLVIHDGQDQAECSVSETAVTFGNPQRVVELTGTRVLREGPLQDTAFQGMGPLRFAIPARVRGAREWRWLSRASLQGHSPGWAVHERVRW